jgi:hypothetical protein
LHVGAEFAHSFCLLFGQIRRVAEFSDWAPNKSVAKGVDHSFAYIYCTSRRAKQKLMQNQSVGSGETVDTPAVFRANYALGEGQQQSSAHGRNE